MDVYKYTNLSFYSPWEIMEVRKYLKLIFEEIQRILMNNKTINYYNKHAKSFIQTTRSVDFTNIQNKFLSYLPPEASILDFGCGSGRDTKYFLKQNYNVTAIDGSEAICKEASRYTGIKVKQMLFEEFDDQDIYDGIWACASILHLPKEDLLSVFHKMNKALKENGIIYTSFKYGKFEGERNGRYFTDFTEDTFKEFILQIPQLQIKEIWITGDAREGRGDERWLNILIYKGKIS